MGGLFSVEEDVEVGDDALVLSPVSSASAFVAIESSAAASVSSPAFSIPWTTFRAACEAI